LTNHPRKKKSNLHPIKVVHESEILAIHRHNKNELLFPLNEKQAMACPQKKKM
jgi:hypothetical protein